MDISIQQISNGAPFLVNFQKVVVDRCYYVNASEERVESTNILSQATATMMRIVNNGSRLIKVFDNEFEIECPLAKFRTTSTFYHKSERAEVSQTSGNEILEEIPLTHSGFEDAVISMFMISKQQDKTIAFLLANPKGIDDYYYRIMFQD